MEFLDMGFQHPYGLGVSPDGSPPIPSPLQSPSSVGDMGMGQQFDFGPGVTTISDDPPDPVKEKIHFIINNLTKVNLRRKRKTLKAILKPEYFTYFCRYLVVQRVSKEPNCHDVYSQLLDASGLTVLKKQLLDTTYEYVKMLLGAEYTASTPSTRTMLRNLGSWLGLVTVAREKPVRSLKLPIKELVLESCHTGRLGVVLPFVGKILEHCANSKVFKPPNPWLMGILSLLREIFEKPSLPMQLQLAIEVLFDNLHVKIGDVRTATLLKARGITTQDMVSRPPIDGFSQPSEENVDGQLNENSDFNHRIIISPAITLFSLFPQCKTCVPAAIDRALKEVLNPVYQRSVIPACKTTQEILLKDFALEADELKVRKAAHLMVASLTSSLVLVHARDATRLSIATHLRVALEQYQEQFQDYQLAAQMDATMIDQACSRIAEDNVELSCAIIDKAAVEQALQEIDNIVASSLHLRKQRPSDRWLQSSPYVQTLPDLLRPSPALLPQQIRVYDEFSRYPVTFPLPSPARNGREDPNGGWPASPSEIKKTAGWVLPPSTPGLAMFQETLDKLVACLNRLGQAISRFPNHKITPLASLVSSATNPGGSRDELDVGALLQVIPGLLDQYPLEEREDGPIAREILALTFARESFKRLYDGDNIKSVSLIDAHVHMLKLARAMSPQRVVREVTQWLLQAEDDNKLLVPVTALLFRNKLLHQPDLDLYLALLVRRIIAGDTPGQPPQAQIFAEFLVNFVRRVSSEDLIRASDFPQLVDALRQTTSNPGLESITSLLQCFQTGSRPDDADMKDKERKAGSAGTFVVTRENAEPIMTLFEEWINIQGAASDKSYAQYLQMLGDHQVLATPEKTVEFFVIVTQLCVDGTFASSASQANNSADGKQDKESIPLGSDGLPSTVPPEDASMESLATLVVFLVKFHVPAWEENNGTPGSPPDANISKIQLLKAFLYAACRVVRRDFEICSRQTAAQMGLGSHGMQSGGSNDGEVSSASASHPSSPRGPTSNSNPNPSTHHPNGVNEPQPSPAASALNSGFPRDGSIGGVGLGAGNSGSPRVFNPRPYLSLLSKLLLFLNTPDPVLDSNNMDVLLAFGHCFRLLRPARVPGFALAWLELISHRMFMPKLLIAKLPQCCIMCERLLVDLFEFMHPYLRNLDLNNSIRVLYKGTLRVLLVLVRDFPEFLGDYHFSFCDVIPATCVQLRNLILAAFPRDMELPNPFTPNLKVDLLQITQPPYVASDITQQLMKHKIVGGLTTFLSKRAPASFLSSLGAQLLLKDPREAKKAGTKYNVPLLNSLILYVGLQGIIKLQSTTGAAGSNGASGASNNGSSVSGSIGISAGGGANGNVSSPFHDNACMDLFDYLAQSLEVEGRYYFLNAIANQLRFPNNHTHYFSCLLLHLFLSTKMAVVREQITRVLLERVICHPPHPWGLLITFIELIKNPRYQFWEQPFIKCHPEIERLFDSVARICVPQAQGGAGGAGVAGVVAGVVGGGGVQSQGPSSLSVSAQSSQQGSPLPSPLARDQNRAAEARLNASFPPLSRHLDKR